MDDKIVNKSLQKIGKGAGIIFIGTIIGTIFALIGRILIARNFTQSEYGIFSLALALLNIFVLISSLGLNPGSTRFIAYSRGKKDIERIRELIYASIRMTLVASLLCSLFLFISAEIISENIFHIQGLSEPLRILSLTLPFVALINIFISLYRGFDRADVRVYFQEILRNILFIGFLSIVIIFSLSFLSILFSYLISFVLTLIVFIIYFINKPPTSLKHKRSLTSTPIGKNLLYFSIPLLIMGALNMIWQWADTIMLGYFKSPETVGLYNAAIPVSRFLTMFLSSVVFIFFPIASYLYSRKLIGELRNTYAILTKWIFIAVFPVFLIMFLFPDVLLSVLFGSKYVSANITLQILALGIFVSTIVGPSGATLVAMGKTKLIAMDSFITTITNISLNILLIPKFGIVGAACASAISIVLNNSLQLIQIYQVKKIHPFTNNYAKLITASVVIVFIIYMCIKIFVNITSLWAVILYYIIFVFASVFSLIFTKSIEKSDLVILLQIEKKLGLNLGYLKKFIKKFI